MRTSSTTFCKLCTGIIFILAICSQGLAQIETFPEAWEGIWSGELKIYQKNRIVQQIPMKVTIQPVDSNRWTYKTEYFSPNGKTQKAYELIRRDENSGSFSIDENNGIVLDAQLMDGCLYSVFEVMGNLLRSRLCLIQNELHYEISTSSIRSAHTTGDTIIGTDTIPKVTTYAIPSVQRAVLRKDN